LSKLLSEVSAYFDSKQKNQFIPFIAETLSQNEGDLITLIDSEIDYLIRLDLDFEKISNITRSEVKFKEYKILSIRPK
jgi:hypothetical protein